MTDRIYMDYAATAPVLPEVLDAMLPFFTGKYGNPSAVYGEGRETRKEVERARRQAAEALGAESSEVCFTSGGPGNLLYFRRKRKRQPGHPGNRLCPPGKGPPYHYQPDRAPGRAEHVPLA